ncbi:MAG: aminoglycoside phosphotransferase family protein, partial [Ruminococcus sp.]|nr:aminoglycoside phosphotransferase family protein [Candidatus Apopatosoma intestinale]
MNHELNICRHFDLKGTIKQVRPITDGLINHTYRIETEDGEPDYVLQRINTNVFRDPEGLMRNVKSVCAHIAARSADPVRESLTVIPTTDGKPFFIDEEGGYWRVYLFIPGAKTIQAAENDMSLYYAAKAFGHFQRTLGDFDASTLVETIPHFHDTVSRYGDFLRAYENASPERKAKCEKEVETIMALEPYAHLIVDGLENGSLPLRVTHNDTKLNNVMLDSKTGEGICVIDLDTVMPGSLLYDFGDGVRFAACNSAEDERDLDLVFH